MKLLLLLLALLVISKRPTIEIMKAFDQDNYNFKKQVEYQGQKHCELLHMASGNTIATDAPKDNFGKGEAFSPTDLCSVSLAACMLTVMGIEAEKMNLDLKGSHSTVVKHMLPNPRKISTLEVELHLLKSLSLQQRAILEKVALNCPVKLSLHPEINFQTIFSYDV